MRVTLTYDSFSRDRAPLIKIQKELKRRGVTCYVISSGNTLEHSIVFKPHVIVIGNPDLYHGENAALLSDRSVIFSLPTEQGILTEKLFAERVIGGHNRNITSYEPPNLAVVKKFFLWANYQRDALVRAGVPPDQLFVSGNPRLMNLARSDYSDGERSAKCIGVALETEIVDNLAYNLWALDGLETAYGSFRDYYTLDVNILDAQIKVIKQLRHKGYHVVVRPRTIDRNTDYSFLGADVEIDLSSDPSYILKKSNFIVTGQSSIGMEAYLYGAKVISVLGIVKKNLVTDLMKQYLTFQHPNQPSTVEELVRIIGNPSLYMPDDEYSRRLSYYFGSGGGGKPESKIAEEIQNAMLDDRLLVDQTRDVKLMQRIMAKYSGLNKLMVANRHNWLGVIIAAAILARRLVRNITTTTNGN